MTTVLSQYKQGWGGGVEKRWILDYEIQEFLLGNKDDNYLKVAPMTKNLDISDFEFLNDYSCAAIREIGIPFLAGGTVID